MSEPTKIESLMSSPAVDVAAPVTRLSHLSLRTPRLDEMVAHYTTVLGLTEVGGSGSTVHLACSDGTPALELQPADSASLDHLAFDLVAGADLDDAARQLERVGIIAKPWRGVTPAGVESLMLTDPDGALLQIMARRVQGAATVSQPQRGAGIQPHKLGHVASRVADLSGVVRFYQNGLGFRFSDSIGDDFVFMRCNADHHSVNFLRVGAPRNVHHLAFELQDWNHIKTAADELWSHRIPLIWGPGRHGAGHNIYTYHRDPDGNIVELFAELDHMSHEGTGVFDWRPWHDGPQRPKKWGPHDLGSNGWGILPPDNFLF
jgi:catechol-2,3-dioxygenase